MAKNKKAESATPGPEWLTALEEQVGAATERLDELQRDNERLAARVEELEAALEKAAEEARKAAGDAGGGDAGDGDAGDGGAEEWRRERGEIRARVEQLTTTLEDLLEG